MKKEIIFIGCIVLPITGLATKPAELTVPPGFKITLYAKVPHARQLALGNNGTVFVGTRDDNGKVYAVTPNNDYSHATKVYTIAKGLNSPNGVAFHQNNLYVAEIQKIIKFPNIEQHLTNPGKPIVVTDQLPKYRWHGYKYIAFGPDNLLYAPVGFPCNSCEPQSKWIGTILTMTDAGKNIKVFANGIRNTVGFAWQPKTNILWFTDNGRDDLGDNLPPDEINRAPHAGMNFGFPCYYGNNIPVGHYKNCPPPSAVTPPTYSLPAHVAPLGLTFYNANQFPRKYHQQMFVCEHGSWARSTKVGYQVILAKVEGKKITGTEPFITGFLKNGKVSGRPVDTLVMPDGSLLVSDDYAGRIYRVTFVDFYRDADGF